jgi:hypothetical protein
MSTNDRLWSVNKEQIRQRGKVLAHQLKLELGQSGLIRSGDEARKELVKRAKPLIKRENLSPVEQGILLQYIISSVTGVGDIDQKLDAACNNLPAVRQNFDLRQRRYKTYGSAIAFFAIAIAVFFNMVTSRARTVDQKNIVSLATVPVNLKRSSEIEYNIDLSNERFFFFVPPNYTGKERFGLVVYVPAAQQIGQLPDGWADVLSKHKLLLIAPQNAGNQTNQKWRQGLAVLGALSVMNKYNIDSSRVYAAGISGGARTAGDMGFYQPDLFSGTIQSCGADFTHSVAHSPDTKWVDSNGNPYGVIDVPADNVRDAKAKVRFALITGPGDFRHGNILDLYNNGYKPEGYRAKLFDVPGMGHQDCSGQTLDEALNFIAGK